MAADYGRYGYRQVKGLLNLEGWQVAKDRVYRIWRDEGLKVAQKQPKRARLWLADGSCVRQRPEHPNHVWSYDFVAERTHEGRPFKILNIIDEYTKECLASMVGRSIRSQQVILTLADLFLKRGCPRFVRSDNGPEFIARKLIDWMTSLEIRPLFIEPGSPWENGYIESFNGKMRYELLNGEIYPLHRLYSLSSSCLHRSYQHRNWDKNSRLVTMMDIKNIHCVGLINGAIDQFLVAFDLHFNLEN